MKDVFIENINNGTVDQACKDAGLEGQVGLQSNGRPYAYYMSINGIKTEYSSNRGAFRVGYNKKYNNDIIDLLFGELTEFYSDNDDIEVIRTRAGTSPSDGTPGGVVDVAGVYEPEDFVLFCTEVDRITSEAEGITVRRSSAERGVSFEGTFFFDLKERGATMGGMFGNMVCEASGMKLVNMKAEKYTSSGEIDGVEYDDNLDIISIYECQSGIHHGSFLDDNHLDKSLGRYLYDPEIIPTVRKVVILAGGYTKQHLNILKERSYELANRKQPIEIVLLRTVATDTKVGIGIEVVELF